MFDIALTKTNFERIDYVKLITKDDGDDAEKKINWGSEFCCSLLLKIRGR